MLKFCSVRGQWTYIQRVEITQNIYGYNLRDVKLDYFVLLTKCSFKFCRNRTRVKWVDAGRDTQTRPASGNTWRIIQNQRRRCPTCHWHRIAKPHVAWPTIRATRGTIRFPRAWSSSNSNNRRKRQSSTPRNQIIERIRLRSLTRTRTRICSKRICVRSIGFPWTLTAIKSSSRLSLWSAFSSTMSAAQVRKRTKNSRSLPKRSVSFDSLTDQ